jgi:hypothetical protein
MERLIHIEQTVSQRELKKISKEFDKVCNSCVKKHSRLDRIKKFLRL